MMKSPLKGIIAVIAGSLIFGIIPSGNNFVLLSGMHPACLLFYQALVMVFASALMAKIQHVSLRIPVRDILTVMGTGFLGIYATSLLLNVAYTYLAVSMVILINFLYPTVVLLISILLFREKSGRLHVAAICCGFTGLLCVTDLSRADMNIPGFLFALLSGVTYAVYCVLNERLRAASHPLAARLFYMSVLTCGIASVQMKLGNHFTAPVNMKVAAVAFLVVGMGCITAYGLILYGISVIGAGRTSVLNMLEPVAAVGFGILFFREPLTTRMLVGGVFILLSILLVSVDAGHVAREKE